MRALARVLNVNGAQSDAGPWRDIAWDARDRAIVFDTMVFVFDNLDQSGAADNIELMTGWAVFYGPRNAHLAVFDVLDIMGQSVMRQHNNAHSLNVVFGFHRASH
jgi:hypothetical protein